VLRGFPGRTGNRLEDIEAELVNEGIERILVATDGSADAREAARLAARVAAPMGARVTLVHVAPIAGLPLGTTQLGGESPEPGPEDEVHLVRTVWEGSQAIL
jgi:nucleotide-binding universal stress UspA family protein